jgi:transposase
MKAKKYDGFRRPQVTGEPESRRATPSGRRNHAVLLGYHGRSEARQFLESKGLEASLVEELLQKRAQAEEQIKRLPPLADQIPAALPIEEREAIAEIGEVMARP